MENSISHSGIIIWTVGFFFTGIGIYGVIFFIFIRQWKEDIKTLQQAAKSIQSHLDYRIDYINDQLIIVEKRLDAKKVDVILYVEDKEKAEILLKSLETRERSDMLRMACQTHLVSKLDDMNKTLEKVLKNQEQFEGLKENMELIRDRQKHVIDRLDKHINGSDKTKL